MTTVLIVGNDHTEQELVSGYLKDGGYTVIEGGINNSPVVLMLL